MTTYTTRTITTTRREWAVPAGKPYGAAAAEIGKAWAVAERAYREQHDLGKDDFLPDNALVFTPGDDEIVINFTIEAEAA